MHAGHDADRVTLDKWRRWLCCGEGSKLAAVTCVGPPLHACACDSCLSCTMPFRGRTHPLSQRCLLHLSASKAVTTPPSLRPPGAPRQLREEGELKDSALCSENDINKRCLMDSKVTKGEGNTEKRQSEKGTGVVQFAQGLLMLYRAKESHRSPGCLSACMKKSGASLTVVIKTSQSEAIERLVVTLC